MKSFVGVAIGGLLLAIPAMSMGSEITFNGSGSPMFDPHGSGTGNLPASFFYRSYDCRIGSPPVTLTHNVTPPPPPPKIIIPPPNNPGNGNPPDNGNPPGNNPPGNPPTDSTPIVIVPPAGPTLPDNNPPDVAPTTAAVPLPAPSEMAGMGLAATTVFSWLRARRQARRSA
jgi:hypothetical protein